MKNDKNKEGNTWKMNTNWNVTKKNQKDKIIKKIVHSCRRDVIVLVNSILYTNLRYE